MLTKKHFQLIAKVMRDNANISSVRDYESRTQNGFETHEKIKAGVLADVVARLGYAFACENPRFDLERFVTACRRSDEKLRTETEAEKVKKTGRY